MQIPNFILFFLLLTSFCSGPSNAANAAAKADVGVILDLNTTVGKIYKTCILMSIEDFYSKHENYSTRIVPHFKDSRTDVVAATSSAVDLLKNTQVMAIFGPQHSVQADFVIDIGNKGHVPIISPATSPAILPEDSPYFIRSAWSSSAQAKAINATVKHFGWREVSFIYQKSKFGSGLLKDLFEGLIKVSTQTAFCTCPGDDEILKELYNLKTMQTRVFVVHMEPKLASRFFKKVKKAGMMEKGYVWIIVDPLTSLLYSMDDPEVIEAMEGVIGLKAYVPRSNELNNFKKRWSKRFVKENPEMEMTSVNDHGLWAYAYGLWAYDSIMALAEAVEHVGVKSPKFEKPIGWQNLTDLDAIGTSSVGESLAPFIRNYTSKGMSGNFTIINGELQPSAFEIVNVIERVEHTVGFWTERYGFSKTREPEGREDLNLKPIQWPGLIFDAPKGWEIPTSGTRLRVGYPTRSGNKEIIGVENDTETGVLKRPTGFSIDVFEEVMNSLPYAALYDYEPFYEDGEYEDLVKLIENRTYDAVVGDVTITAKRTEYADFTVPYTESGVVAIVPIRDNDRKNTWIFMKPLTPGLWRTILAFFVFMGFVIWVLEHRVNQEFRGSPSQQVGMIFYFSFSTLVFAHREKIINNLTRIVMIVWLFVVLVLTQSYTASLTSMLTVQQLQPTITNIDDLIKSGRNIGYQKGSFVREFLTNTGFLNNTGFDQSKLIAYTTAEFNEALSNGSVAAIVDEVPYVKLFLSEYCYTEKYTTIGPTFRTSGFGFAFTKGSPLVPDVSREILKLKESEKMVDILRKWHLEGGEEEKCQYDGTADNNSERLSVDNFKGLFVIAGVSSLSALAMYLFIFWYKHKDMLSSTPSIQRKIYELAKIFCREKDEESSPSIKDDGGGTVAEGSPAISITVDHQELFSQDEGLSALELATHSYSPCHTTQKD